MSRHTLQVDFDYTFELIAIISSQRDYRLCWQINRALHLDLSRRPDLEITNARQRSEAQFPVFVHEDEINFLQYFLISNKSSGNCLIPELKQVDYLLMLRGDTAGITKYEVMQALKDVNGIQAVFESNPAELRSKQNLIFE